MIIERIIYSNSQGNSPSVQIWLGIVPETNLLALNQNFPYQLRMVASIRFLFCFFPIFASPLSVCLQIYFGLFIFPKLAGAVAWPAFSDTLPTPNMKSVFGIAGIATGVENR